MINIAALKILIWHEKNIYIYACINEKFSVFAQHFYLETHAQLKWKTWQIF